MRLGIGAALAPAGARVIGVDINPRALNVARKRLPLLGLDAQFREVVPDWLESEVDESAFSGPYDLIVSFRAAFAGHPWNY